MSSIIFTPSVCQIDLGAIRANFKSLGQPDGLMPVIKSDAYGHGLLPVAKTLAKAGAKRFAVGLASEGAALREAGFDQQIALLLGCLTPQDWQLAVKYQLTPIVGSLADAQAAQEACGMGKSLEIAIKCDTGMGRLGFPADNPEEAIAALLSAPSLRPVMVLSHLACADMPEKEDYTKAQVEAFTSFHKAMSAALGPLNRCLDNSAAAILGLDNDISRPGLAIYGGNPLDPHSQALQWAMSLSSPILHIHALRKGQSVSYGSAFTADQDMRIAVICCGYASGYHRNLSNKASMLVNGQRCRQLGRICMGMSMIDISSVPEAKAGDRAWLLGGPKEHNPVDAWELADMLGTIPYELLCHLGGLNPRVYINE